MKALQTHLTGRLFGLFTLVELSAIGTRSLGQERARALGRRPRLVLRGTRRQLDCLHAFIMVLQVQKDVPAHDTFCRQCPLAIAHSNAPTATCMNEPCYGRCEE
jgi:hypothetical protein